MKDEGEERLRRLVEAEPGNAGARLKLAKWVAKQGRAGEAIEQLKTVLEVEPENADAHVKLIRLLGEAGDAEAEVAARTRRMRLVGPAPEDHDRVAQLLLRLDRPAEAVPHLIALAEASPSERDPWERAVQAAADSGDAKLQAAALRRWLQSAERPDVRQDLIRLSLQQGLLRDAAGAVHELSQVSIEAALSLARELADKAGEQGGEAWRHAALVFETVIAAAPEDPRPSYLYGAALLQRDLPEAESHLRRSVELAPSDLRAQVELARALSATGELDAAADQFEAVLGQAPGDVRALCALAAVRERQGRMSDAYGLYDRAVAVAPEDPKPAKSFSGFLGRQLLAQRARAAELEPDSGRAAAKLAVMLEKDGRTDAADAAFRRAAELDPKAIKSRKADPLMQGTRAQDLHRRGRAVRSPAAAEPPARKARSPASAGQAKVRSRRPGPWPSRDNLFRDFEALVRRYALSEVARGSGVLTRTSRVVTMGSCFAEHVARRLEMRGIDVFYRRIGEDVNSTYANRHLMDWIADGPTDAIGARFEDLYGAEERMAYRQHLAACDLFIFSLGVAPCLFADNTGEFRLSADGPDGREACHMRTTTLAENVGNMRRIIERLRALNPAAKLVLTVSPVPLGGTSERASAVLADCVSKSVLRLTAEEILNDGWDGAHYWPSFEIVRWLAGHAAGNPPPFAANDGDTRHVSVWLQDLIIGLFIEYFGDGTLEAATA